MEESDTSDWSESDSEDFSQGPVALLSLSLSTRVSLLDEQTD
jgi:hypothetical protein